MSRLFLEPQDEREAARTAQISGLLVELLRNPESVKLFVGLLEESGQKTLESLGLSIFERLDELPSGSSERRQIGESLLELGHLVAQFQSESPIVMLGRRALQLPIAREFLVRRVKSAMDLLLSLNMAEVRKEWKPSHFQAWRDMLREWGAPQGRWERVLTLVLELEAEESTRESFERMGVAWSDFLQDPWVERHGVGDWGRRWAAFLHQPTAEEAAWARFQRVWLSERLVRRAGVRSSSDMEVLLSLSWKNEEEVRVFVEALAEWVQSSETQEWRAIIEKVLK
jgi:hypothetical protein